jgi:riboflavin synthase
MFTGLIEAVGTVVSMQQSAQAVTLVVKSGLKVGIGDSVAVNGVCLTVTTYAPKTISFNIMAPTLKDTTLSFLKKGQVVNLERALLPTTRLGGHFVAGHVDDTGQVLAINKKTHVCEIEIAVAKKWFPYIVQKGSLAIDGISLTVQAVKQKSFIVGVIPHTLANTGLKALKPGASVNLEFDMLAKYIENIVNYRQQTARTKLRYFMR